MSYLLQQFNIAAEQFAHTAAQLAHAAAHLADVAALLALCTKFFTVAKRWRLCRHVCSFVCLSVTDITEKYLNEF